MNHPSEWARYFDENTGRYRYKLKGSGVIRDTLMTIGKVFKKNIKDVANKTAEKASKTIAEKAGQRVAELAGEKGSKQIRKILQERKKQKPLSQDAKKKLANILTKNKKKSDALVKLNRILANEIKKKIFVLMYKLLLTCSEVNHTSRILHSSNSIWTPRSNSLRTTNFKERRATNIV